MIFKQVLVRSIAVVVSLLASVASLHAQDMVGMGVVRGHVSDAAGPVENVAICIIATGQCAVSAADGGFAIAGVRAGTHQVEVVAPGRAPFSSAEFEVRAGLDAILDVALPEAATVDEVVTVRAPAFSFPPEIKNSAHLIPSTEILAAAGALQDVSRYAQVLPGVAPATDDFRNDLIVRGGSPLENLFIVDNIEIPNINAFATFASAGGTFSMVDAAVIQDVTFLTGGFPAPFGTRTSSVMQITTREGDRRRTGGRATIGFAGAGVVLEGPLGSKQAGSWIVSARRSFLDLFADDVGIGGVPRSYTFNAKLTYDLSPRDRVWLVNVTGLDDIRLGLTDNTDLTSALSTLDIRYDGQRSATGVNWQRSFGARAVGLLGVTHSRAWVNQRVTDLLKNGVPPPGTSVDEQLAGGVEVFGEDSGEADTTVKYDLTAEVARFGKLQAGINVTRVITHYASASPFGNDSPFFPAPDLNPFRIDERLSFTQVSGYLQGTRSLTGRLSTTLGGRVDRFGLLDAVTFSPRVGLDYALGARVSLRASYGRYTQQPFTLFLAAYPGNRSLAPFRADHYVAGIVMRPGPSSRLSAEFYEKRYDEYPVSTDIGALSLANIGDTFALREILFPMTSGGTGRARGLELSAERGATDARWRGQANLSFASARHSGLDGVLRPGSFDSPIIANLTGVFRAAAAWDVSARVSYLSGRPYTPFELTESARQRRAVYDVSQVNTLRLPDYLRVDIRVDRRFSVNDQPVTVFAGVQNAINRRNVAGYSWDRRANGITVLDEQGVFPILGLDWRF
jgi:hypothetical protein